MNINYTKNKYLKYKKKYLDLKKKINSLKGGSSDSSANNYKNLKTYNEFTEILKEHLKNEKTNNLLIVFFAPWCGYCTDFLTGEVYENLVKNYGNSIFAVDGDKYNTDLQQIGLPEIVGFPTLYKFIKKQTPVDLQTVDLLDDTELLKYFELKETGPNMGRTENAIIEFLNPNRGLRLADN